MNRRVCGTCSAFNDGAVLLIHQWHALLGFMRRYDHAHELFFERELDWWCRFGSYFQVFFSRAQGSMLHGSTACFLVRFLC